MFEQSPQTETAPRPPVSARLPVGAEFIDGVGVLFRVWAPRARRVEVVFEGDELEPLVLDRKDDGRFTGIAPNARPGALYRFRLDQDQMLYPDPASRFQPDGPHGPSEVIDASTFRWNDQNWRGVPAEHQVLYEMHIGTFTSDGTWEAAIHKLPELVDVGITCLEVMPVAEFAGQFGWGYDGVDQFAPTHLYGRPDDFRRFVDRAHALGLGVILDVVYNHFGPDGCYLKAFSPDYFSKRHKTDWGEAINFDGENNGPVREFFKANARHWIEEYHLDGFRFDATQNIYDDSREHILAAITREARQAGGQRQLYMIAENEPQETKIVRPLDRGGFGMNALWNDDFHHSALVALSGRNEAYLSDYHGKPQELICATKFGYLFQGQYSSWQKKRRGTPAYDLPPTAFVNFLENHDQLANLVHGSRVHWGSHSGIYKALTALLLLAPQTPMLFQGQEFASSSPFVYFADHKPELAALVRKGRKEFLCQFPSVGTPEMEEHVPDPATRKTFLSCKLDWSERNRNKAEYHLHRDLLSLRRDDPTFRITAARKVDGAVMAPSTFLLRFFGENSDDRLMVINLGRDLKLAPVPEALLGPPEGKRWRLLWSSEHPRYGGSGTVEPEGEGIWRLPGQSAVVLRPADLERDRR